MEISLIISFTALAIGLINSYFIITDFKELKERNRMLEYYRERDMRKMMDQSMGITRDCNPIKNGIESIKIYYTK